jgi:hypothetical protein
VTQRANQRATKLSAILDLEYFGLCSSDLGLFDYFDRTTHKVTQRENQRATKRSAKVDLRVLWTLYFVFWTFDFGLWNLNFGLSTQKVVQRANQRATKRSARVDLEYFGLCNMYFGL